MFNPLARNTKTDDLDEIIQRLHNYILTLQPNDAEYAAQMEHLTKLHAIKEKNSSSRRVSPDAWVTLGGSLAGVLLVVGYEHAHALTSKGLGLVKTMK